jgi:hypothetical protein
MYQMTNNVTYAASAWNGVYTYDFSSFLFFLSFFFFFFFLLYIIFSRCFVFWVQYSRARQFIAPYPGGSGLPNGVSGRGLLEYA